ncbi:hypothetical protein E2R51_16105 [Jeotgalibacillus sp. S-D1]|uniref:hypothetical protein n=1 Tax=Jeotgalibacillus sp. S-D1 TaxID=2552189 RepID=UPI00105A3C19|nr:hypothetical protein [Jeotgalibacillus sp. S-D1]TDL30852.1 hypothetical protein E2R51_16105 [Jeotgalibacillus sp. S-D1]
MRRLLYFVVLILLIIPGTLLYEALTSAQKAEESSYLTKEYEISLENPIAQSKEPIAVSFVQAASGQVETGTLVTITGEVDLILTKGDKTEFGLSVNEEHGYGVYVIQDDSGFTPQEGDRVKVKGVYRGDYEHAPLPLVLASKIEVIE